MKAAKTFLHAQLIQDIGAVKELGPSAGLGVEHHGQGVELAISRGVSGKARAVRLLLILIKNKVFGQIGSPLLDIVLQHPEEAALLPLLN